MGTLTYNDALAPADTDSLDGLISAALEIATRDASLRRDLKQALIIDDPSLALRSACSLLGVKPIGSILALIRDKF